MRPTRTVSATISSQKKEKTCLNFQGRWTLSQVKRESKLISRNPTRFLDAFADGKCTPKPVDTDWLVSLVKQVDLNSEKKYEEKGQSFLEKHQRSKTRSLLLNISSNPITRKNRPPQPLSSSSRGSSPVGDSSRSNVSSASTLSQSQANGCRYLSCDGINERSTSEMETTIAEFLEDFKNNSEVDNIFVWISNLCTLDDFKLPFGLPANLKLPKPLDIRSKNSDLLMFVESASDEFLLLDAEYKSKLEQVSSKLMHNFSSLQSSGWSTKNSALLYYLMSSLGEQPSSGHLLQGELLKRLFPAIPQENIISQKYRLKMKRAWEEKRDSIIKDWVRDKEELQLKTNTAWESIQGQRVKHKEWLADRRKQQESCKYWKELLENMRKEKRLKVRRISILVEPYEKAMEEKERKRLEEGALKRQDQKRLVENFQVQQVAMIEQQRKYQQWLQEQLALNTELQAKYNRTRVIVRQHEYEKKKEAQKELEKLKDEERQLRERLLEESKEEVEIDYDPSMLFADTHASLVRRYEVRTLNHNPEEEEIVKFFRERYSFSAETVMKDRRVKLESKLRDAGLINSTYARQVLQAMEPVAKPHLHSQIKFDNDKI